jgi:hypothetical protein
MVFLYKRGVAGSVNLNAEKLEFLVRIAKNTSSNSYVLSYVISIHGGGTITPDDHGFV